MSVVPPEATEVLQEGTVCYLAAAGADGPHLTPVVFVHHAGRIWVTTSRRSRKARIWARRPETAGLVRAGERAVAFRGSVTRYDVLDPTTWPDALAGAPAMAQAWVRFSVKNLRFVAGYARDAHRVPLAWLPPGRILAAVDPEAGALLDRGAPAGCWGRLDDAAAGRGAFRATRRRRPPDAGVPADLLRRLGRSGRGALCVEGPRGLLVLPVAWARAAGEGAYYAVLPRRCLALAGAGPEARAALVLDRASWWRAARMLGVQVRGRGEVFLPEELRSGRRSLLQRAARAGRLPDDPAVVRLRPGRVVWWKGWSSGTV